VQLRNEESQRGAIPLGVTGVKKKNLERNAVVFSLAPEETLYWYESEKNDTFCRVCHIKYCNPITAKLDEWLQ